MNYTPIYVDSKITGGHFALKTDKSSGWDLTGNWAR